MKPWKALLRGARTLFSLAALACLAYFAWRMRATMREILASADVGLLCAAVVVWGLRHGLIALFTVVLMRACGGAIGYAEAFRIHAVRLPARYLPGGIWHAVSRAGDYHRGGLGPRHVLSYVLLEHGCAAGTALAIGGPLVAAWTDPPAPWRAVIVALAWTGAAGLLAQPLLVERFVLGRPARIGRADYAASLAWMVVSWVAAGLAFNAFLGSLHGIPSGRSPLATGGIYIFSWGIGFLAFFAPQGIGVSEFVAGRLLGGAMDIAAWMALLAGFRCVGLLGDLATWAFALVLRGPARPPDAEGPRALDSPSAFG